MSVTDALNVYFVTTGKTKEEIESAKNEFLMARTYLQNHIAETCLREINGHEGYALIAAGTLTKQDVFVFDRFQGDFFEKLQKTKSLIVGPRCITACMQKCEPIPLGTSPVYTTAMRGLRISASGLTQAEKERISSLVHWMGGYFFLNFDGTITHLVANTIKSTKYEVASSNGIPVMHADWVQRVWNRSSTSDISATDEEFDKYKLPIFFGVNITCTGLDYDKRNEIMRLVNENGGVYHRAFRSNLVDIVITELHKTNSEKYVAAVRCKKDILLPSWVFDSVEKGYALPIKAYQVKSLKVSTPTKSDQSLADFTQDISRISVAVARNTGDGATINDTGASALNDTQELNEVTPVVAASSSNLQKQVLKVAVGNQYRKIYDEICPKKAKKAGIFLDGCSIYLSGFRDSEREKLNRILNVGGATRHDEVNEKVTHVIVGQLNDAEFKVWKRKGLLTAVHIVRLDWLLESIKLKQPASENIYRVSMPTTREPEAPSPSSKRTLRSMNHSFKQPDIPIKKKLFGDSKKDESLAIPLISPGEETLVNLPSDDEKKLISHYSQDQQPLPMPPLQSLTTETQSNIPTQNLSEFPPPIASSTLARLDTQTDLRTLAPLSSSPSQLSLANNKMAPRGSQITTMNTIEVDYNNLNFFQGVTVYVHKEHFPDDFYTQVVDECEAAQGNVVESNFRDPADYAIVSFERVLDPACLTVRARQIVTDLYVEAAIKENKLVPIQYYHKYVPHTASALPLRGMTIVISTYTGLEQDFIDSIAQLLGGRTNVTYAKKERPLLVCPKPDGSKYEAAIKWGYPVVNSQWLVHCAERGEKLPYDNFLVGRAAREFSVSPALREELIGEELPQAAEALHEPASAAEIALAATESMGTSTPTSTSVCTSTTASTPMNAKDEVTPLRNKRVSELLARGRPNMPALINGLDSPHTPQNRVTSLNYNYDIMDQILANIENEADRKLVRDVILDIRNTNTPELERIRRQACTPIHSKVPTPKGIPEFCTTPEFEKRMADAFEQRWHLPTKKLKPDTPIEELRRRVLRASCKAMGVPFDDSNTCDDNTISNAETSVERSSPTSSSMSMQNKQSCTTPAHNSVAPRTLFTKKSSPLENNKTHIRSSDNFVPATQASDNSCDEKTRNDIPDVGKRSSMLGKSTINFDKLSFEESEVHAASPSTSLIQFPPKLAKSSPEMKQITDYLKNCESRRQSLKRSASNQREPLNAELGYLSDLETQAHYVAPFESEQFGPNTEEMVGWRDPGEFSVSRRSRTAPAMQFKGTPYFIISCADDDVREDVIRKIRHLGGEVSDNVCHNYDPSCTHFVCERPNRGEKMLGCISAGKWLLSLKYVEECYAKDMFIDEELYEWGNSKALNMPELAPEEKVIAQAAYRWRKQLATDSNKSGAFSGIRAILRLSERNCDALRNVLKAGDASIIDAKTPYSKVNGAHMATHCFVDIKKMPLSQLDYKFLKDNNVQVFSQMYIFAYLTSESDETLSRFRVNI